MGRFYHNTGAISRFKVTHGPSTQHQGHALQQKLSLHSTYHQGLKCFVPNVLQYYIALSAKYPLTKAYKSDLVKGSWEWLEKTIISTNIKTYPSS